MRVFKTRAFQRWLTGQQLNDEILLGAVREIASGLVDAHLGGHLYKKRIALSGRGKRGSARTLVAVSHHDKAFFLYGFEKNEKENITRRELQAYRLIAKTIMQYTDPELSERLREGSLIEIVSKP